MNPVPSFPSTQWTRLERDGTTEDGREWFCETYRPAVLKYLLVRYPIQDAEDLCQEFFARMVLDRDLIGQADRNRGSLRGLLRTTLDRFLSNRRRFDKALKRGGGAAHQPLEHRLTPRDGGLMEDHAAVIPDRAFDQAWASLLLERALQSTEADCREKGKLALFMALRPMLDGSGPARAHREVAVELGVTARDVTVGLSRLRQRVAMHLYEEVSRTVASRESISEEWDAIRMVLEEGS